MLTHGLIHAGETIGDIVVGSLSASGVTGDKVHDFLLNAMRDEVAAALIVTCERLTAARAEITRLTEGPCP